MSTRLLAIVIFVILLIPIIRGYNGKLNRDYNQKLLYRFFFFVLCAFVAFRPIGIDQDSVAYQSYYNSGQLIWLLAEPTFGIISIFVSNIFGDFRYVLIIYALIGVGLKFYIIPKLSNTVWLCLIIYYSTYFLLHEFTQIRAGIASGLFLVAIYSLYKGQWKHYIFLIIIACLFHYSAVVLLPLVLIKNVKLTRGWIFILSMLIPLALVIKSFGSSVLVSLPIELVQRKTEIYMTEAENADVSLNIFNLIYISKYIVLYFFLFKYKKYQRITDFFPIILSIYAFSLFFYIGLSWNTIFAMRISELFGVVEILLIPLIHREFSQKAIGNTVVICIAAMYLWANIYSLELIYPTVKL